jgi:hemolysin activation/secretion protein
MQVHQFSVLALLLAANIWGRLCLADEATTAAPTAKPQAEAPKFNIWEFRVLGNSRITNLDIERTLYPFLGPNKMFDSVEAARSALEKYYHDQGFGTVFVDIPEQDVADGIVRLRVTEGKLAHVKITGARYFAGRILRAELPEATAGSVPNVTRLQQQLAEVNAQSPDLTVVPVLHAGSTPGTVDLDLKVQDHLPLHGSLELDNARTPDTKPLRSNVSLSYDNVGQRGDSFSIQYQTAPQDLSNVKVIAGTYVIRFSADAPALTLYAVDTHSDVATIGTLSVLGTGDIFGARVVWPITNTAARTESVSVGLDYKKFLDNVNVTTTQAVVTNVNYLPFTLSYSLNLTDPHGITSLSSALTWGVRGLVSSNSSFENTRYDAPSDFIYFRGSAARTQQLPYDFSARLQFDGQVSTGPLISNEQFAVGGEQSVRGYFVSEELGDSGLRASFELRSPALHAPASTTNRVYAYGFYDWAAVDLQDPLPSQSSGATLRSTGAGLRFNAWDHLDANIDWAYVLESGLRTHAHDSLYNFSIRYGF